MRPAPSPLVLLLALALGGCDDKPAPTAASTDSAKPTAAPPTTAATAKPKPMPELLVDPEGPYLAGRRVDMKDPAAADKLAQIIKDLPIEGKPVTLLAEKKARTPHVAAVVAELGKAGAPRVLIKTDGRDDLPKEITLTPESRVSSVPACSVAGMVLKDLSTAVWRFSGGTAKKQRKGFAGPDLSHTGDALKKDLAGCDSTIAVISGDDTVSWEMTYNLAGTILGSDEKKRVDTLILPREAPVAGRPITLGK